MTINMKISQLFGTQDLSTATPFMVLANKAALKTSKIHRQWKVKTIRPISVAEDRVVIGVLLEHTHFNYGYAIPIPQVWEDEIMQGMEWCKDYISNLKTSSSLKRILVPTHRLAAAGITEKSLAHCEQYGVNDDSSSALLSQVPYKTRDGRLQNILFFLEFDMLVKDPTAVAVDLAYTTIINGLASHGYANMDWDGNIAPIEKSVSRGRKTLKIDIGVSIPVIAYVDPNISVKKMPSGKEIDWAKVREWGKEHNFASIRWRCHISIHEKNIMISDFQSPQDAAYRSIDGKFPVTKANDALKFLLDKLQDMDTPKLSHEQRST